MIRRVVLAAAGLGVLLFACNSTPEIPNDLKTNSGAYPGRGGRATTPDDSEASNEGEQELTGGRAPTGNPPENQDAGSTATTDAGGSTPTPATDAGGATPTPTPVNNQCAGTANQSACFKCCEQQNPGTAAKWNGYWDDCACAANKCGSACAQSWCAGFLPNQGDACDNCLNQVTNTCSLQADAVCKQDATCAGLVACDEGSGCQTKPQ